MSASASSTVRRARPLLHLLLLAVAAVLAVGLLPAGIAVAAAPAVEQCNGVDNVGGQEVRCEVTVANVLDVATGVGSSTVTVQECHGPAGAPTCGPISTTTFPDVVLSVRQCEGSGSGGGGVVACSVRITNDLTGAATTAPATVNQCNGSGEGGGTMPTTSCSPIGSTTGVSITQCNGSGNGGGATVTCRGSVTSNVIAAPAPSASPTPSGSATASPSSSPTPSPTGSPTPATSPTAAASTPPLPTPSSSAAPRPTPSLPDEIPIGGPDIPISAAGPPPGALPPGAVPPGAVPPAALPPGDSSQSVPQLPRTGSDLGDVSALGLALLGIGTGMVLLTWRPRPPAGRHVRRG